MRSFWQSSEASHLGRAFEANDAVSRIQAQWLTGGRLHLNDGPIDLVILAEGAPDDVRIALQRATSRFSTILNELTAELRQLRTPIDGEAPTLTGQVAKRMRRAAAEHSTEYLTPMICVAGAVADEVLETMTSGLDLSRVYVNNGGDIALHLDDRARFRIGAAGGSTPADVANGASVEIERKDGIGGIATSGLGGRSMTLGIADSVTVLSKNAAAADAAATLIANAVNVVDQRIERTPARDLDPDSDLGDRLVTIARHALPAKRITEALDSGCQVANQMLNQGLIRSALLQCESYSRVVGRSQTLIH